MCKYLTCHIVCAIIKLWKTKTYVKTAHILYSIMQKWMKSSLKFIAVTALILKTKKTAVIKK